jgi:RHS repeat-associated protein
VTTWLARDRHGRVVAAADSRGRRESYRYDAAGRLTSAGERSFAYDAAGRLCADDGREFRYDAAGRLIADGPSEYGYDEVGRRVREVTAGRRRDLGYDPITGQPASVGGHDLRYNALGQLAAVDDTALAWDTTHPLQPPLTLGTEAVVAAHAPWATVGPAGIRHLHPDRQGTPSAAAVLDAWGADGPGTPEPRLGYRGELVIDDLVWLRRRTYHPATRAFLQTDPWPPVPGTAVAANPYHYAGNDPVNQLDPFGLRPVTDDAFTRGLRGAGDWLGDNWEYLAGGALVVGGIALSATGIGGIPGVALMTAGGALMGAGGSMLIQKGTTGRVDLRRAAIDTAVGAVPLGGTARLIGAGVREIARTVSADFAPGARQLTGVGQPEIVHRAMSHAEREAVEATRRITPR